MANPTISLEEIRARDPVTAEFDVVWRDRTDLLQRIDSIREAAGRMVCWACREFDYRDGCPDCNDLRRLLEVK